jgi:hypothetical protein
MNKLGRVAGINLLILFCYMVLIYVSNQGTGEAELGILLLAAFSIAVHVFLNFVLGIYFVFKQDKAMGRAFLLSAGIVLVVGFSSCFGAVSL